MKNIFTKLRMLLNAEHEKTYFIPRKLLKAILRKIGVKFGCFCDQKQKKKKIKILLLIVGLWNKATSHVLWKLRLGHQQNKSERFMKKTYMEYTHLPENDHFNELVLF